MNPNTQRMYVGEYEFILCNIIQNVYMIINVIFYIIINH